jgi:hypothetical protein
VTCPAVDDQDDFRWPGPNRDQQPGDLWRGKHITDLPDIADYQPTEAP